MFSEDEQEIIIREFLNMISRKETAEYLKDKCSKCWECKFTKENMELYKMDLPRNVLENVCRMNYNPCHRCDNSNYFIKQVDKGKYWKPVDWSLFTTFYQFPNEKDFEEKFPKYNMAFMEMIYDMMGDKEFKTKNDVRVMIDDIALELNIKKYNVTTRVKQFNKVIQWIYEKELSSIPLNFCPKLKV